VSTSVANSTPALRTYGNWRQPTSPGIGSLGLLATLVLLGGTVTAVITAMAFWPLAVVVVFFTIALLVPLSVHDRHRRNGCQVILSRLANRRAVRLGSDLYRSGPLSRVAQGKCRLPGIAAGIEALDALDGWGRPFALLSHPHLGQVTAVIAAASDGAALVDNDEVDNRVAHWGAWLADLGHEPGLVAASVTIESAPDMGTRLKCEVEHNIDEDSPALAQRVLSAIVESYPAGSAAMACYITLTWSTAPRTATGKRRSLEEMAVHIGHRLPGFTRSLGATGAGAARPMATAELASCCRVAYDPASNGAIETTSPAQSGIGWEDAGPAGAHEAWDHYRHDSGVSSSWFMGAAPAGHVFSNTLTQLLSPHPDIARKRVTLVYRPHDPASAAKTVERDRLDAQFAASGKKFGRARDAISKSSADKSAEEEAQGAGLVRFGLIATATVLATSDLELAGVAMENMASASRITLRPAYGCQASAFAATLPLGLVLPSHLRVPQAIREML
jgi:hypothetical protein